jgi:hypothetical protein
MEFVEFDSYKELKITPNLCGNYIYLIQTVDFFKKDIKVYRVGQCSYSNTIINPEIKIFGFWNITNNGNILEKVLISLRKNFKEIKEGYFEGWLDYIYNDINGVISTAISS